VAKTTTAPKPPSSSAKVKKKTTKAGKAVKAKAVAQPTIKTKTPPRQHAKKKAVIQVVTPDEIAVRAYEIWIAKGRPVGLDQQNWLDAEAELLAVV